MTVSVLIVEDEFFVAMEMEHMLQEAGYVTVGIAPDAKTALKIGAQMRPDIALVDVNLKDGPTGPFIAQELNRLTNCTIIFITANPRMIHTRAGALGVMEKPVDDLMVNEAVAYAQAVRNGYQARPPERMVAFR